MGVGEASDVARYLADMTAQLEAMASAVDLDLLAYFLGMAKAEADLFIRRNTEAGQAAGGSDEVELGGHDGRGDNSVD